MAQLVFIVGPSGSGKSTSLRNLNPDTTIIGNADEKALPFRKFSEKYNSEKGNYFKTSRTGELISMCKTAHKTPEIKSVVLDTWSRIMTNYVMDPDFRKEKGFDKYSRFASDQYDLINMINNKMRDDIIVYLFCHPEIHYDEIGVSTQRIAVQGKALEKFVPESFSSIVLYTEIQKVHGQPNRHVFSTKNSGTNTCKTPLEMFEEDFIDNDLSIVEKAIREYYAI